MLQVVLEYERAVIFRLGQLLPGGAKGPGDMHWKTHKSAHSTSTRFLKLCGDFRPVYRSALYWILQKGWSPHHYTRCPATGGQRLFSLVLFYLAPCYLLAASDKGQRDCVSGRRGLLPRVQRHRERDKREGHSSQHKVGFSGNISEFLMRWPFSAALRAPCSCHPHSN